VREDPQELTRARHHPVAAADHFGRHLAHRRHLYLRVARRALADARPYRRAPLAAGVLLAVDRHRPRARRQRATLNREPHLGAVAGSLTRAARACGTGSTEWSPDGNRVVYSCNGSRGSLEICLTPVAGSRRPQPLSIDELPHVHVLYDPAFSPDGKRLAFTARLPDNHIDVFLVDTDGTHLHRLTHDTQAKSAPQWSPAGTAVAFIAGTKLIVHSATSANEMTVAQGLPLTQSLQWVSTGPPAFAGQTP
jgi:hypothetical protein